jgi:hypothetical protein
MSNGEASIGNVLSSVIGLNQLSQSQLIGTWRIQRPGCAFTSDNLLAKAGGEVAATQIGAKARAAVCQARLQLVEHLTSPSTNDGTFASKIGGKSFSGNYTYDAGTGALNLKGLLLSLNGLWSRATARHQRALRVEEVALAAPDHVGPQRQQHAQHHR